MAIVPCGHRVIVRQETLEEIDPVYSSATRAGLVLSHDPNVRKQEGVDVGIVAAIGPTAWKDFGDGTPWAEVGQRVVFAKYAGKKVEDPSDVDKFYVALNDEDIIAVLKD